MKRKWETNTLSLLFIACVLATGIKAASTNDIARPEIDALPILLQWLKGIDSGKPGSAALRHQLHEMNSSERRRSEDLQSLALRGFDLLGTNAVRALPELRVMAYSNASGFGDTPLHAMISIGAPSWPTATNLAKNKSSDLRRKGAYLLGALQTRPEESVPVLLKLVEDSDTTVSSEALTALVEFPRREIPPIVRNKLADPNSSLCAAFSIHTGDKNAMQLLIDTCQSSTQRQVRIAALGALAFRERRPQSQHGPEPRRTACRRKWCDYTIQSMAIGFLLSRDMDQEAFLAAVKSNIVHHQEARVTQTASNFLATTKSRSASVKFSPRQIPGQYFRAFPIAGGDTLTISTNGTFTLSRSGCVIGDVSEVQGRVERDGDIVRLTQERRSTPRMGRDAGQYPVPDNALYPVFWDRRTYLVPTNAMARFCAIVNAGQESRFFAPQEYLVATDDWKVSPRGMPEVPDAWKGYLLPSQIRGKVWRSINTKEAWIDLRKTQGVLPGMILFCYDPERAAPYRRVPEVTVVEVLDDRARVVPTNPAFSGLYNGLVVSSGRVR
jgi:hypothetical protein